MAGTDYTLFVQKPNNIQYSLGTSWPFCEPPAHAVTQTHTHTQWRCFALKILYILTCRYLHSHTWERSDERCHNHTGEKQDKTRVKLAVWFLISDYSKIMTHPYSPHNVTDPLVSVKEGKQRMQTWRQTKISLDQSRSKVKERHEWTAGLIYIQYIYSLLRSSSKSNIIQNQRFSVESSWGRINLTQPLFYHDSPSCFSPEIWHRQLLRPTLSFNFCRCPSMLCDSCWGFELSCL